jgi:phosphatidylserine/phosphatidylglycerophosphate/cardiolipin synthase-like enzyme
MSGFLTGVAGAAAAALLLTAGPALALDPPPVDPPTVPPRPSPTVEAPAAAPARQVLFNYPTPGAADMTISERLVELIDATPAGESISMSYFVIQPGHPVIDSLLRAHGRGVNVRVVLDSGDGQKAKKDAGIDAAYAQLAEALGTEGISFARQCIRSCITAEPESINHNKFAAFSRTGPSRHVVFQGTGNLRTDGSGDSAYNAAVILREDAAVYEQYLGYFLDLYRELRVDGDDYAAYRPPVTSQSTTTNFFPRTDGGDTLTAALRTVDCAAQPTTVRVMAAYFSRETVRDALRDMAHAGCTVQVLARQDTITRDFCTKLDPGKVQIRIASEPTDAHVTIHAKYVLIDGSYAGGLDRRVTWMGSHNLTDNALERNDETFLELSDPDVAGAFSLNWVRLWNDPTMSSGCDRARAANREAVERSADTEVTRITRQSQSAGRALPRTIRRKQVLGPAATTQGKKLRTVARCKPTGSEAALRPRKACRVTKRNGLAYLVIRSRRPLRVQIVQRAKGDRRLLPFTRTATYRHSPARSVAVRV